jgi:hypothetical protein
LKKEESPMKRRICAVLTASILVLSFAGIGSASAAEVAPAKTELPHLYKTAELPHLY